MNLKDIGEAIRHAVVEDDAPTIPPDPPHTPTGPALYVTRPMVPTAALAAELGLIPDAHFGQQTAQPEEAAIPEHTVSVEDVLSDSAFLDSLRDAVDFAATPIGRQIQKHLAPLDGLALTEAEKFGVVLKAGAEHGVTPQAILDTFEQLKDALADKVHVFDTSIAHAGLLTESTRNSLDAERAVASGLEQQLEASRRRQADFTAQLQAEQKKIDQAVATFHAAIATHTTTIESGLAHYTSLLKGKA